MSIYSCPMVFKNFLSVCEKWICFLIVNALIILKSFFLENYSSHILCLKVFLKVNHCTPIKLFRFVGNRGDRVSASGHKYCINVLGVLDPSAENTALEQGTTLELPYWMVKSLVQEDSVRLELPRPYRDSFR